MHRSTTHHPYRNVIQICCLLTLLLLVASCGGNDDEAVPPTPTQLNLVLAEKETPPTPAVPLTSTNCPDTISDPPANALTISMLVPVISDEWPDNYWAVLVDRFNRAQACGLDPVTLQPTANPARPIWVEAKAKSSGDSAAAIVNAVLNRQSDTIEQPTIYVPALRYWLKLVNYQTSQEVFDVEGTPATSATPIVIAIWKSRLDALQSKYPNQPLGWQELYEVFQSPNGWVDYGLENRYTVAYGHASPYVSSVGLATLFTEFYAAAIAEKLTSLPPLLGSNLVNQDAVQQRVHLIELLTKHYYRTSTELRSIVKGPEYLDFVALPEDHIIFLRKIKQYNGDVLPANDTLLPLYPKEGVFLHEHPPAILNAPWVSAEQRTAAERFQDYLLSKPIQRMTMEFGFRPADKSIPLECPVCPEYGIDPDEPRQLLPFPEPVVAQAMLDSWRLVKKQADILVLVDVSDSMNETHEVTDSSGVKRMVSKLEEAKAALQSFINLQSSSTRIALMTFNHTVTPIHALCDLETCKANLLRKVGELQASNKTALYDALIAAIEQMTQTVDSTRIQAIVLLSDGQHTVQCSTNNCSAERRAINQAIAQTQQTKSPLLVIPIAYAYGQDDPAPLNEIAHHSHMSNAIEGDVSQIKEVLRNLGEGYFSIEGSPLPSLQIGLAINLSGDKKSIGLDQIAGAQYAAYEFNKLGGVNGMEVELLVKDTKSDTSQSQKDLENSFQQLLKSQVVAMIGPSLSDQAFALSDTLQASTVPILAPSNTAPGIPELGDFFMRVSSPGTRYAHYAISEAIKQGETANRPIQKVAVAFAEDDAFSRAEALTFQQAISETYQLTLASVQHFSTSDVKLGQIRGDEFTAQIAAMLAADPQLVIVSGLTLDGGTLIKQLRQAGYAGWIIGGNGINTPRLFEFCHPHCTGVLIAQAYNPERETPVNQAFVKAYQSQIGPNDYPYPPQFTAQAFTAVQVIVDALKRLSSEGEVDLRTLELSDPQQLTMLRQALNNKLLSGMKFQTPLGELWFDAEGEVYQKNFYVAQIVTLADGSYQFDFIAEY